MHFEGDQIVPLPPDRVWPQLSDAAFLVGCLADAKITKAEADVAEWSARPALAFASGSLDVTLTIIQRMAPSEMRTKLVSKGIGATSTVTTHLVVSPHNAGSQIHWQAEITELTGLLKMVPKGLIQSSARKVIEEVWQQVAAKMGEKSV